VALGATATLRRGAHALPSQAAQKPSPKGYSFAQFSSDFGRNYVSGSAEYKSRAATFEASLNRIHMVNAKNQREGRKWSAGVHEFMDWTHAERTSLKGYKPNRGPRSHARISALQLSESSKVQLNMSWSMSASGGVVDSGSSVSLRNQGTCGSCWAISAVEAVEARLPGSPKVSAQALVDCVPNPRHCGGSGGCDGATGELAYEYVRDHGLPLESSYAYTGKGDSCHADTAYPTNQRVRISGWTNLESNKAQPLMDALYNSGPVVVAVDADSWFDYDNGVFDGCKKDAILDHAVLAKGYGGEGDGMWWRIQNSWGSSWGEEGHIRLKRRDPEAESAYCGRDTKPSDGLGCDGGPAEVTVCGECGLLMDPIYPEGVTLENSGSSSLGDQSPAAPALTRDYNDYLKVADQTPTVPQVQEPTAPTRDYSDYFKMDSPTAAPQVQASAVAAPVDYEADYLKAASSSTVPQAQDLSVDNLFGDKPQSDVVGASSASTDATAPSSSPAKVAKSETQRMKDLFQQNFLQAVTEG